MTQRQLQAGCLAVALLLLGAVPAGAAPRKGVGLFAGLARHSASANLTSGALAGQSSSYSSSGLSVGGEYQFLVPDDLTVAPFVMTTSERTGGALKSGQTAAHGILGIEGRKWKNDAYVGAHVGLYWEGLSGSALGTTMSASGLGFGLAIGWESPKSQLFAFAQLDQFKLAYADAEVKETGVRVQAGYRWK
jgi:hypothetical protein